MSKKKAIPELSPETRLIFQRLQEVEVGEIVTYKELSELIGMNTQERGRSHLLSARRKILHEFAILFEAVRGEGVKRLDDSGALEAGQNEVKGLHRKARRGAKKLACADVTKLKKEEKERHAAASTILAFIHRSTSGRAQKIIGESVKEDTSELPFGRTLKVFLEDADEKK
jgi:hypothetical protein